MMALASIGKSMCTKKQIGEYFHFNSYTNAFDGREEWTTSEWMAACYMWHRSQAEDPVKIYISGPMTGVNDYNKKAFKEAELWLISQGHRAINPHNMPLQSSWRDYMRQDLQALFECDAIYMLKGWWDSKGATLERQVAMAIGLKTMYEQEVRK